MKSYLKSQNAVFVAAAILMAAMSLTGCKGIIPGTGNLNNSGEVSTSSETSGSTDTDTDTDTDTATDTTTDTGSDTDTDINFNALDKSVEAINNLTFDTNVSTGSKDGDTAKTDPSGEKTVYSFCDVYADGNDLTIIPNGGLNSRTALLRGKDLNGFLDYVDSEVLEKGRNINRDFFYDMLAVMLVDKDLSSDEISIEKNIIMSLAMANKFYDTDVKINDCYINAANAAEYRYHVTAYGKDDTWVVNYRDRTMYMNDGKTEYVSEMFEDENLAVWMVAIEDYYGIVFK